MITGELKNKVDKIWEIFWTGGITNPLEVIEQFNYLSSSQMKQKRERKEMQIFQEFHTKEFFQQIVSSIVGVNLRIWEMRMRFMI